MKGVWILFEYFTDGCTYGEDVVYSIHESEEGASLAADELVKLQTDPKYEGGVSTSIKFFEINP
jgi:hypothetical protein